MIFKIEKIIDSYEKIEAFEKHNSQNQGLSNQTPYIYESVLLLSFRRLSEVYYLP